MTSELEVRNGLEVGWTPATQMLSEWDALADRLRSSPFTRAGWVLPWNQVWGRGARLLLLTAHRAGELVGALPLNVRGRVTSSPTNWHSPEYAVLADDPVVESELLAAAIDRNRRRLQLGFVDESTVEEVTRLSRRAGRPVLSRVLAAGPSIDLAGSFAEYESSLDKKMRSDLRRRRRRLDEVAEVSVEVYEQAHPELFEEFLRVEAAGWKGTDGTAVAAHPPTRRFYAEAAGWASTRGWLRFALLRVGDRVIAGDLAFEAEGVHYLLKTGFDPEYRRFAPGKLLRSAMIERAFADGLRSYEFLGMNDPWKLEWTTTTRRRLLVQVFDQSLPGRLDRVVFEYGRPAAKTVVDRCRRRSVS